MIYAHSMFYPSFTFGSEGRGGIASDHWVQKDRVSSCAAVYEKEQDICIHLWLSWEARIKLGTDTAGREHAGQGKAWGGGGESACLQKTKSRLQNLVLFTMKSLPTMVRLVFNGRGCNNLQKS